MRTGGDVTESTPGGRLDLEKGPARSQPVDPATPRGVGSGAMAPVHVREEAIRRDLEERAALTDLLIESVEPGTEEGVGPGMG